METTKETQKKAVKPSLREQAVLKLIEQGLSREDAIQRVATEEGEARRTAVVDELTRQEARILKPTCPGCGADPIGFKRLRYDFKDGVLLETVFCNNPECRIIITAQITFVPGPARPRD